MRKFGFVALLVAAVLRGRRCGGTGRGGAPAELDGAAVLDAAGSPTEGGPEVEMLARRRG